MDPQLIEIIKNLDEFTRNELFRYNKDLQEAYKKYVRGNSINDKESFFKEVAVLSAKFAALFAAGLVVHNVLSAKKSLKRDNESILEQFGPKSRSNKAKTFLKQQADRTAANIADNFLKRKFPGTKTSVEQRITTVAAGSERVVRNIVNLGIKDGKSAWEIAKEIEAYVVPNDNSLRVAPWTITRRELGKPVSYIPKGVPAGSVEYNAFRIARAETVETYHQAPYIAHKDKWYYNGTKWHLSRSHPKKDKCDEYATHNEGIGKGVWRELPKLPHPHCLCWTETLVVDPDEMADMFLKLNW